MQSNASRSVHFSDTDRLAFVQVLLEHEHGSYSVMLNAEQASWSHAAHPRE